MKLHVFHFRWSCLSFCLSLLIVSSVNMPLLGERARQVSVHKQADGFQININGKLFTRYVTAGHSKPIFYPVMGPLDTPMTRNYPMKKVKGEAEDHPHHQSLWYTHGRVNGVDFWHKGGKIVHDKTLSVESGDGNATIITENKWVSNKGDLVCREKRRMMFSVLPAGRAIDITITINACNGDVVFGDTKEGSMAIRTHPNLRLTNDARRGVTTANGKAVNSEGHEGAGVWGKRAKWVDYWGEIDGRTVGVGIFDHPKNPRHPTWWHARTYGLIAANPFGIHDFEKKPSGTGDLTVPAGKSVTFRYRFVFHQGDAKSAKIAEMYKAFAAR